MRFTGKVCIVTGGATGIGGAIVERLLAEGAAHVAICDIRLEPAKALIERTGAGDRASMNQLDVTDAAGFKAFVDKIVATHGRIDLLFNNAGVPCQASYAEMTREMFDKVMGVNAFGIIAGTQAVADHMTKQGGGAIVNTLSVSSYFIVPGSILYSASKFGAAALNKGFARELAPLGIRINGVCPGMTKTPLWNTAFGIDEDKISDTADALATELKVPMGHAAEPWDMAASALFLASDDARYITGEMITVDGGWMS